MFRTTIMNNKEVLEFIISQLAIIDSAEETQKLPQSNKLAIIADKIFESKSVASTYSQDHIRVNIGRIYTKYKNNKKRPMNNEWNDKVCFEKPKKKQA